MNIHLSTTAWIFLIALIVFIVAINLSLITALRNKTPRQGSAPPGSRPRQSKWSLRSPWQEEDEGWNQLSQTVRDMEKKQNENNPSDEH